MLSQKQPSQFPPPPFSFLFFPLFPNPIWEIWRWLWAPRIGGPVGQRENQLSNRMALICFLKLLIWLFQDTCRSLYGGDTRVPLRRALWLCESVKPAGFSACLHARSRLPTKDNRIKKLYIPKVFFFFLFSLKERWIFLKKREDGNGKKVRSVDWDCSYSRTRLVTNKYQTHHKYISIFVGYIFNFQM